MKPTRCFANPTLTTNLIVTGVLFLASTMTVAQGIDDDLRDDAKSMFGIVDAVPADSTEHPIVQLGHELFWDVRLSANGRVACASCHTAAAWGSDAEQYSVDAQGKLTKRNSQTVFNAMLQPGLRWTADRTSGTHQAEKSLTGSMGFTQAEEIVPLLRKHGYEPLFKAAFPQEPTPLTPVNYARAIEAYEATLTTPAALDRFLAGDDQALDAKQKEGLRLFMEIGCADCHSGKLLGGEGLEKFGIHADYWEQTKSQNHDEGLFESTHKEGDKFHFRVSMLRNIEKTGPYFHDGSVASLKEAIRIMAKLQLDQELDDTQIESLFKFLKSLSGEVPSNYIAPKAIDKPR